MLLKVEGFLTLFPHLKTSRKFRQKLKNIDGFSFLATLSELSIAAKLKEQGFSIAFEKKFKQVLSQDGKDADISATNIYGNTFHIEVYTPNRQLEIENYMSDSEFGNTSFTDLNEQDGLLERSIKTKLLDKFGEAGISGLNGRVFLAINIMFFDTLHIKSSIPGFKNNYKKLCNFCPKHVDGLILFKDEFGTEISFRLIEILVKNWSDVKHLNISSLT